MILNVILIAGGLLFLLATGLFLFALGRAPLGTEDENGFHLPEVPRPVRPGKFNSGGAATFSNPTPNAPIFAL